MMLIYKRFFLKWTVNVFALILIFSACRKNDQITQENNNQSKDYTVLKSQFFNASTADAEVQKVADDIRKQDSVFKFLPEFVKKNGIPKWDKTVFKVKNKSGLVKSSSTSRSTSTNGTQGVFFIPLQSQTTSEIKSYITAYKHNDSLYTYRLYNRDSLSAIHPATNEQKNNILNTQAVFGVFEKSINNLDSIDIQTPFKGRIKNAAIHFDSTSSSSGSAGNTGRKAATNRTTEECFMNISVSIEYFAVYITDGTNSFLYERVTVVVEINIYCSGGGGGGTGWNGPSNDPNGGTGGNGGNNGNYNWWNFGSGWPWNSGLNNPNDPVNWQYWWTGGGGGGYYGVEIIPDASILGNFIDDPNYFEDDNISFTFDPSQDPWPSINNVLPVFDFVEYDYRNCLVLAKEQIAKANVRDLGYGSAYKTYTEQSGIDASQSKSSTEYIISKLRLGKPVMVGVDNRPGTPSPVNADGSTDHFVVIVGAGSDAKGNYFTFFDNATNLPSKGTSTINKLYYDSNTGEISGKSAANGAPPSYHDYIVTQVRKNK